MTLDLIQWIDASSTDDWTDLIDICMDAKKVLTIGLVIKENETTVAVSTGYDLTDKDACCTLIIPKVTIIQRQTLAEQDKIDEWITLK